VPATTEKGLELGALEVTVMRYRGWGHDYMGMDAVFEALRRKGIDIGRPFVIHVDQITGITTARQEAWTGE